MIAFFEMGGYAAYVWPCWGLSAVALGTIFWLRRSRLERARRALRAHEAVD